MKIETATKISEQILKNAELAAEESGCVDGDQKRAFMIGYLQGSITSYLLNPKSFQQKYNIK